MQTASFWRKDDAAGWVVCELCPNHCRIKEGQAGLCKVRQVIDGELKAFGYGLLSGMHSDPIEKKPLYHFLPGSEIFSIGGWGCNFSCSFCQNWQISQQIGARSPPSEPEDVIRAARYRHSVGVAYTYNEPLINFEFVRDCAVAARRAGLLNVLVTNGFVEPAPAAELLALIDALNIDVKSIDDEFYRLHCHGSLKPVLNFTTQAAADSRHVEITNLLIPGLNDSARSVTALADWIAENLGRRTPLHLSAYHPQYKMKIPATPAVVMERAWELCRRKLDYVYIGNLPAQRCQDTLCPQCAATLVVRRGYSIKITGIEDGVCRQCARPVDLILSSAGKTLVSD